VLARQPPAAGDARDARRHALTYDDAGAGPPVLYFHGGGDWRLSRPAETHGVRVIGVDRCGERVQGRTLRSWAGEVEALADELGLERFGIVGWSAGGPHALAVAAVLPERVDRVALVASMPPPAGVSAMPRDVQLVMRLARRSQRLAARGLEQWGRRPTPTTGQPAHDEAYARGRGESFRHGGLWLAQELAYLGRPWGFELAEVTAPVTLWWGERDHVTPPELAHAYARDLPNAELKLVDDTHQLLFSRWREILADAAPQTRP
jgi:pimeloyl-ACP methyl ester carboxylesterase